MVKIAYLQACRSAVFSSLGPGQMFSLLAHRQKSIWTDPSDPTAPGQGGGLWASYATQDVSSSAAWTGRTSPVMFMARHKSMSKYCI